MQWKADLEKYCCAPATFPIIADDDMSVAKALDMLPADAYLPDGRTAADSASVRVVFIFSPDKKLQLSMTYPMSVGRNFAEVLRALDALQATYKVPLSTPANWEVGRCDRCPVPERRRGQSQIRRDRHQAALPAYHQTAVRAVRTLLSGNYAPLASEGAAGRFLCGYLWHNHGSPIYISVAGAFPGFRIPKSPGAQS